MSSESNEDLWLRIFNLSLIPKSFNYKFNCEEYSSSCPKCGGEDRVSVFAGNGPLIAVCWNEDSGRSGCGKRFFRKDLLKEEQESLAKANPTKDSSQKRLADIGTFIERSQKNITHKDNLPTLLYAKKRGFNGEDIKNFQIGSTFKHGKGFGLVLPVFRPQIYCQIRWIGWDATSSFSKYQNPPGGKPSHAFFPTESDCCLVFESLIDAMLIHANTGYSTIAAMGASLKDRILCPFKTVYLVPDQDDAGERCFGLTGKYPILSLPEGYKDIGEIISNKGIKVAKYLVERLVESKQAEGKQKPKIANRSTPKETEKLKVKTENTGLKEETFTNKDEAVQAPSYSYVKEKEEAVSAVEALSKCPEAIALDTETTGLNFRKDKIRLVQLYAPTVGCYLFDMFKLEDFEILKPLENKHFIIQYAPFDVKFLSANGIKLTSYEDTKMMAALTYPLPNPKEEKRQNLHRVPLEYRQRDLSLKGLLKTYLGLTIGKEAKIRTGWEGELSEEKLEYAAKDVLYLHRLHRALKYKIETHGFKDIYPHYVSALRAHIKMEEEGAPIRKRDLIQRIEELDPLENCIAFIEKYGIDNPNSTKQLSDYVLANFPDLKLPKTAKGNQVKLGKDVLEDLDHPDPFFKELQSYRKQVTSHREHVKLYEATCSDTDRAFTNFNILGASSGRTITREPNFQGQSNAVKPFIGYEGEGPERITAGDYSQQELRIFSLLTNNETFLKLLGAGEDGYKGVAATVLAKAAEEISEEERKLFKAVTLALLYGKGIKAFAKDVHMEEAAAKEIYLKVQKTLFLDELKGRLDFEHKRGGQVKTIFGKTIRPIKDLWRTLKKYQLINYCIQGTASNIGILALNKLAKEFPEGVKIIGYIHDEFLLEHNNAKTEEVQEIMKSCMVDAFLECFPEANEQKEYLVEVKTNRRWMK